MRKLVFTAVILALATISSHTASADDYYFLEKKREAAAAQRMALLEQIQHKQANPQAYLANMEKKPDQPVSVSFDPAPNGHYYIPGMMNGRTVSFIADTGASSIFLTQNDARKIGLNVENLNYNKVYNTANGQVKAASTTIPAFKVGPIELSNVEISVSSVATGQSLLGMSFFHHLSSYDVKNNTLTLYK